jgi:preprotein translocase subunit SecG
MRLKARNSHARISHLTPYQGVSQMVLALSILLVITSVLMVLLVLLHKGKGSGLSDLFGGGVSSTYGGSSVVERNLDRITIVVGGLWFAGVVALSLVLK